MRSLSFMACLLLAGCAAGPKIDTRYTAVSQDSRVQFIVLHYTEGDFATSLQQLTQGNVSSHYLVDREPPTIYRLVDEDRRAWHAGRSYWNGYTFLNASSVGIEIVNAGNGGSRDGRFAPYPDAQIEQVVALVRDIARRHGVKPHRIVGHSDIQPQTKQDPGPQFPWRRLADEGLVPWPDEAAVAAALPILEREPPTMSWYQEKLAQHGFEVPRNGELDAATRNVLSRFQMKYRPSKCDGTPDAETAALLSVVTSSGGLLIVTGDGTRQPYVP
jgi:N-acetylmuramoyl-L-alanine amidase